MPSNLATGDLTMSGVMEGSVHGVAEVDADADAHVEGHRQEFDAGPARAAVVRVQLVGFDDASGGHCVAFVAFGDKGESQTHDGAGVIADNPTGPAAAAPVDMVSSGDADDMKRVDCESGDGDVTFLAHDRDVDWIKGDVQEPVEASVDDLVQHVVEKDGGSANVVNRCQVQSLRVSHVFDPPSES